MDGTQLIGADGTMTAEGQLISGAFDSMLDLTVTMLLSLFNFFVAYLPTVISVILLILLVRGVYNKVRSKFGL